MKGTNLDYILNQLSSKASDSERNLTSHKFKIIVDSPKFCFCFHLKLVLNPERKRGDILLHNIFISIGH